MKKYYASIIGVLLLGSFKAQVCTPTFLNGCANWHNNYVVLPGLDWTFDGVDCSTSDYTADYTANLIVGEDNIFEVEAGNWSGVSIWADLDQSGDFDDSENLFHKGNGGSEIHVFYDTITLPANTVNGTYLLRVICHWGSDGFNPGTNGYGACGDYQYGNFQDFMVNITGGAAKLAEKEKSALNLINPVVERLELQVPQSLIGERLYVYDLKGLQLAEQVITSEQEQLNTSELPSGTYILQVNEFRNKFIKL